MRGVVRANIVSIVLIIAASAYLIGGESFSVVTATLTALATGILLGRIITESRQRQTGYRQQIVYNQGAYVRRHSPSSLVRTLQSNEAAHDLLLQHLDSVNRQRMIDSSRFEARGSRTGATYLIIKAMTGNVFRLEMLGNTRLCAVLPAYSLDRDPRPSNVYIQMLAQKLMIETDEDKFLEIAKVW